VQLEPKEILVNLLLLVPLVLLDPQVPMVLLVLMELQVQIQQFLEPLVLLVLLDLQVQVVVVPIQWMSHLITIILP
jgi:hypothetical protein